MKILDFEFMRTIGKLFEPIDYYNWVEDALKNKNEFYMPIKSRMNQQNGDYYACMPAMWEKNNVVMLKMIGRHNLREGENRSTMMSDMMIYRADTGILEALVDAEYITTLRTGAIAAFSALHYGKSDFSTIGLIGLGNIMVACLDVLFARIKDKAITIKLYRHHSQEYRIIERYKEYTNFKYEFCDTYDETIRGSDVVISALTRIDRDFCTDDAYKEGCTVIPIMTLGFQNCDLFFDRVFTDEIEQIKCFKYFNKFNFVANTSDVINGKTQGRTSDFERIIVYNYGLSVLDLYFAQKFLERASNVKEIQYNYCTEKFFM